MRVDTSRYLIWAPVLILVMGASLCRSGRTDEVTAVADPGALLDEEIVAPGLLVPPSPPPKAEIVFRVHSMRDAHPISPYIYGSNADAADERRLPFRRLGGNRWTAYNWENNASNAGIDYLNQNDGWLEGGNEPGKAIRMRVQQAHETGAAVLVTVPILGRVAADKKADGDVADTSNYLERRFRVSRAEKGAPPAYPPDTSDGAVFQDEMVAWLENACTHGRRELPLFYSLDNEPALWATTHPRLQPEGATYAQVINASLAHAIAIKRQAPRAMVFGPASYGWMGMTNLQNAKDGRGRDFLETYLATMRDAEVRLGRRLLDVLDVHWYPEARAGGERVSGTGFGPAVAGARVQNPRSLWDPGYVEDSWISRDVLYGSVRLIPRLKARIEAHYPGTKLAITEYNFGGGGHISGAVAQADVLGIFGREGVYAAALWDLGRGDADYQYAAFRMFRDYDGHGAAFGDTSVHASTSDTARTSVYAAVDARDRRRVTLVAINKTVRPLRTALVLTHTAVLEGAEVHQLTDGAPEPVRAGRIEPEGRNTFVYTMPPMSVSTLELR